MDFINPDLKIDNSQQNSAVAFLYEKNMFLQRHKRKQFDWCFPLNFTSAFV